MSDQLPPPLATPSVASTIPPKTSAMAVASLVLGVVSVMGAAVLILPTVLAIVLGHVSLSRIRKDPRLSGSGIAIAGFVLGYVSIVFAVLFGGLVAAMAIPAFQKVREKSAVTMVTNDARQIGAAAQQLILEKGETPIVFSIDPATGIVSGPLASYVPKVSKGTRQVDGVIENAEDTFSLQSAHAQKGAPLIFDLQGNRK